MKRKVALYVLSIIIVLYSSGSLLAQNTGYQVTYGSYFSVVPSDLVGFTGETFAKSANARARYYDEIKGKSNSKCMLKAARDKGAGSVVVAWSKLIALMGKNQFTSGKATADILAIRKISPLTAYVEIKTEDSSKEKGPFSFKKPLSLVPPTIEGIYDLQGAPVISYSQPGSKIIVKGNFFGSKAPRVWLEYSRDGKIRTMSCRVMKDSMIYSNFYGKPSIMDCDVSSQTYGKSQMLVQLPPKWPDGWTSNDLHDLVLDNGVARAAIAFGSASPISPGNYSVPDGFSYGMESSVTASPSIMSPAGEPLAGIRVDVYDENPMLGGKFISATVTDENGRIPLDLFVSSKLDRVFLLLSYVGLPNNYWLYIATGELTPAPLLTDPITGFNGVKPLPGMQAKGMIVSKYVLLGQYDSSGVPKYLVSPSDKISAAFLANVNASIPEYKPIPLYHPDYLDPNLNLNTVLVEDADVWITFVHEGAGYCNLLGYYTYNKNNPPSSPADISNFYIVFPNASYQGSGGGLHSGDKVYLGHFSKDTVIGYFLVPNGWYANFNYLGSYETYYSNTSFNPEHASNLKQHVILLWDASTQKTLLSFEDLNRESPSCDNDFNDVVFYITANPPEAVENTNLAVIDTPKDRDGDGVSDLFDDYPDDPTRAFENYYPAKDTYGTTAFEDMWPSLGDYDFNDLVVRYNFRYASNTKAQMVDVRAEMVLTAVGAEKSNGFGFSMPFSPSLVSGISGQRLGRGYISLNPNGTESKQSKAVVIVSDNVFDVMAKPENWYINTQKDAPYVQPVTLQIAISLVSPQSVSTCGPAKFNHFLIVNQIRGHEVHFPGNAPTDLADLTLFDTDDDDSNLAQGRYYLSKLNMPWGFNIPYEWQYPYEQTVITKAYNRFADWSRSGGLSSADWYALPLSDYIYVIPPQ